MRDPRFGILAKVIFQSLAPAVIQETPEGAYPQIVNMSFDEPRLELKVVTDKIFDENGTDNRIFKNYPRPNKGNGAS